MDRKREKRGMQCYMKKEDNSMISVAKLMLKLQAKGVAI